MGSRFSLHTALFLIASPLLAAAPLTDSDPDLVKTRELVASNQELSIAMTLADLEAAHAINASLTPPQLAQWRKLQKEMASRKDRRTIFDFATDLKLTKDQVTSIQQTIASLKKNLDQSREQMFKYESDIRSLHPGLGFTELKAVPDPQLLVEHAKELGLSKSQVETVTGQMERLAGYQAECQRRIGNNATALKPLLDEEATLDRVKPFVRADAEVLTELTLATLRTSLALHEMLAPDEREAWHELARKQQTGKPSGSVQLAK